MKKAIIIIVLLILLVFGLSSPVYAGVIGKAIYTDWLEQPTLKYGMVISLCASQTLTGATEGYNFGGSHWVTKRNYHTYETLRRSSWIATGWIAYANWQSADISRWGLIKRYIGSAMLARNCFEWSYKYQRYGNPFDYTKTRNEHSLVYFGFRDGKITDLYIGTGPITGPAVDILFAIIGTWLLK